MAERPTTCTCGKRLSKKQRYYRNGGFFCKKRCWETAQAKAAKDAADKQPAAETKEAASAG